MTPKTSAGLCSCCRLPAEATLIWLADKGIAEKDLPARGLRHLDIEQKIAAADPVCWAFLNFVERENSLDDATGEILVPRGREWKLYPIQAKLARLAGNLVVESASEIGKTRDLVLNSLWRIDTQKAIDSVLIAADRDNTLHKAWREIEFQLRENPAIGGGISSIRVKPYRELVFKNGKRLEMIMCGFEGQQFRGGHYSAILADEVAKWKNPMQWSELWRGGKAGCEFRIYSTPDGDYSSPFYALCQRAVPLSGSKPSRKIAKGDVDEPKFRKVNISRRDLPTWSEGRAAKYREQFGPESSVGWLNNVEGKWGAPSYSVFPMHTLRPNLVGGSELPFYRMVVAAVDRERNEFTLNAARLSSEIGTADGVRQEDMLARERKNYVDGAGLATEIAAFFPTLAVSEWTTPLLFCGADLGSSQDPTEILFVRQVGDIWHDVFRLHLSFGDPANDQAPIFDHLDHASGHQAKYSVDAGSFGSTLVSLLTDFNRTCPVCTEPPWYGGRALNFSERLYGRGFGNYTDVIDIKTGDPVLDPDKKTPGGEFGVRRASNKEFSTQVLERKAQAAELRIAWDGGAGEPSLSGPQLLINHTTRGKNTKNERNFRGEDDHHVDARRQIALAIMAELRPGSILPSPAPDNVVSIGGRRAAYGTFADGVASGGMRNLFGHSGGVRGIFR